MKHTSDEDWYPINTMFDRMSYKDQLNEKQKMVNRAYKSKNISVYPLPVLRNPKPLNYRHKVIVSATNIRVNNRFKLRLGLYVEGSKDIKPGVENHIHDEDINRVLVTVEQILQKYKFEAYTRQYRKGIIKHVMIRKSHFDHSMMLIFVTQGHVFPNHKKMIHEIVGIHPEVKTVIQNIHSIDTPIVLLDQSKLLFGTGYIEDEISGLRFRLSPNSFYQVNPIQMKNLYDIGLEYANITKNDIVMDCYSGIGTISLLAAATAKEVIAIEANKDAVKDAILNKKMNQVQNVRFELADVENYMFDYNQPINVLIMDPPRDGASLRFIEAIKKLKPSRIVYISCFVETQVRDIEQLSDLYEVVKIQPVDMFSYTSHVETVTLLERKR